MSNTGKYYDTIAKSVRNAAQGTDISPETVRYILSWLELAYNNPHAFDPSTIDTRAALVEDSINISNSELGS